MSRSNLPPPIIHTDEELLELYLSLSERERLQRFVGTAQAAKITGLSVRTMQLWDCMRGRASGNCR